MDNTKFVEIVEQTTIQEWSNFLDENNKFDLLDDVNKFLDDTNYEQLHNLCEHRMRLNDVRQLAYKTSANAIYGYMGTAASRFYIREVAEAITAVGVEMIQRSQKIVEDLGITIIYGDSVASDTVIYTSHGEMKIEDLVSISHSHYIENGKDYYELKEINALTLKDEQTVYRPIKYVVKHKCNKKIYRVWLTNEQYIDVTEDHSLMCYLNKREYKNDDAGLMDRIIPSTAIQLQEQGRSLIYMSYVPRNNIISKNYTKEIYEFLGYYLCRGSFNKNTGYIKLICYENKNEFNESVIKQLIIDDYIRLSIVHEDKNEILIKSEKLQAIIEEFFNNCKKNHIPQLMFNETKDNICHFLRGIFSSDGSISKCDKYSINLSSIYKDILEDIQRLMWYIGIGTTIFKGNTVNDFYGKISGTYNYKIHIKNKNKFLSDIGYIHEGKMLKLKKDIYSTIKMKKGMVLNTDVDFQKIKNIEVIEYDDYVYDIEIDDTHTFFANGVLVHNTDSMYILANNKIPDDVRAKGEHEIKNWIRNDFSKDIIGVPLKKEMDILARDIGITKTKHFFNFKQEVIAKRGLFLKSKDEKKGHAKKRYLLWIVDEDGVPPHDPLFMRGVEIRRSELSPFIKDFLKLWVMDVLKGEMTKDELILKLIEFKKILVAAIDNKEYNKFSKNISLTKDFDEFKTSAYHVRGAKLWNEIISSGYGLINIAIGSKMKIIFVKSKEYYPDFRTEDEKKNTVKEAPDKNIFERCYKMLMSKCSYLTEMQAKIIVMMQHMDLNVITLPSEIKCLPEEIFKIYEIDKDWTLDKMLYEQIKTYVSMLDGSIDNIRYGMINVNDIL